MIMSGEFSRGKGIKKERERGTQKIKMEERRMD
jgi:hypothetical protein